MIEVELPDGTIVEFPDGTSREVMRGALRKLSGRQEPQENTNPGVSSDAPADMVLNPETGQYTSRELLANADQPSRAQAFGTGSARGITFGGIDELAGGVNAAIPGRGSMAERYTFKREQARAAEDAARRDFPGTTMAGEIGGGVSTALTYGLPAIAQRGALGATAAGAGVGAAEGLAYGALSGEGGARERAASAMQYGLLGGAVGGAAPAVISGAGRGIRGVMDAASGGAEAVAGTGSAARAGRGIASTARRAGMDADDVDAALAAAAREGQPEFRVADALGVAGQRRLSGLARAGGDASAQISDFLNARQLDQGDRLAGFVGEAFPGPNGAQTANAAEASLRTARGTAADVAYSAARRDAGPVDVRGALSVIDQRIGPMQGSGVSGDGIDEALSRFRARLAAPSQALPDGTTARELADFDRVLGVKQDVQDAVGAASRAGRNNEARELGALLRELDGALEAASPAYRAANDQFREASRVIDAVDEGRQMNRPGNRADDTTAAFSRMTPDQQAAARAGYGDRILSRMEATAGEGTNRARPLTSSKAQQEAATMATDPGLLSRRVGRENTMFETRTRALGGSRTADNLEDIADLRPYDMGLLGNVVTGQWGTAAQQAMQSVGDLLTGMNPKTREIMAEAMMARDATALRKALEKAESAGQRQQVLDAIARITAQRTGGAGLLE